LMPTTPGVCNATRAIPDLVSGWAASPVSRLWLS
jgi:hypothetical protein